MERIWGYTTQIAPSFVSLKKQERKGFRKRRKQLLAKRQQKAGASCEKRNPSCSITLVPSRLCRELPAPATNERDALSDLWGAGMAELGTQ